MVSLWGRASFDFTARLWDSVTGDCLKVFTDHTKYVFALSFSPDGTLLASGGGDGALNMYDVKVRRVQSLRANGTADCWWRLGNGLGLGRAERRRVFLRSTGRNGENRA